MNLDTLEQLIRQWSEEAGFQKVGISNTDLSVEAPKLRTWLEKKYHGSMDWLERNFEKRLHPDQLHANTIRVLSFRMNYLPSNTDEINILKTPEKAYISRYALGRDYHKLIRKRLANIAEKIETWISDNNYQISVSQRAFVDSAPILERPLANKAGLGWTGKHTLILDKQDGSWFFLGELFTNLPFKINEHPTPNSCGDCEACLKVCPTQAFPKPYELDATRCISYLTIENKGAIPEEFREVMGNRIYGCDDCQLICPWNKYAKPTCEEDFHPRHNLDSKDLIDLFNWNEKTFLEKTAGSPIRRIGYQSWLRNIAVGLGNAGNNSNIIAALEKKLADPSTSPLVSEHIEWALKQQKKQKKIRKRKLVKPEIQP